jgi:hypothetical protein
MRLPSFHKNIDPAFFHVLQLSFGKTEIPIAMARFCALLRIQEKQKLGVLQELRGQRPLSGHAFCCNVIFRPAADRISCE